MSTKVVCIQSHDKFEIGTTYLMNDIFYKNFGIHNITDLNNVSILYLSDEEYDRFFISLDEWRKNQINEILI